MTIQTTASRFPMPTRAQLATAGRYAGAAAGTAASVAAVLGVMTPEQSAAFVADVHAIIDDMANLFGDVSKLVLLVLPIATLWLGKIGYNKSSPASQTAAAVAADPKTMIAAVQALPAAQVTVSDPALASPGVKVGPVAP
jgi:hypothetical protein